MQSALPKIAFLRNAEVYKVMANSKRLEILNNLRFKELSVEKLMEILKIKKANLSQHLAVLRHNNLVSARRDGPNVYYRIVDPRIVEPCKILHNLRSKKI
jgi:ArsR family transcriptional regulator, virulence genes transcriptional regulator